MYIAGPAVGISHKAINGEIHYHLFMTCCLYMMSVQHMYMYMMLQVALIYMQVSAVYFIEFENNGYTIEG